jgi:hypothetical protein
LAHTSAPGLRPARFATTTRNRPTYAAIFIDAIVVKIRDGQVANRPFYAAIGVSLAGERDVLGLWAGQGGEGAKFWMSASSPPARSASAMMCGSCSASYPAERNACTHSVSSRSSRSAPSGV